MAIKPEGNLSTKGNAKSVQTTLAGLQEDIFDLQNQLNEALGGGGGEAAFGETQIQALNDGNGSFELQAYANNVPNASSLKVTYDSFTGSAPTDSELNIAASVGDDGGASFTETITFADDTNVVGKTYSLLLEISDSEGNVILTQTQDVVPT